MVISSREVKDIFVEKQCYCLFVINEQGQAIFITLITYYFYLNYRNVYPISFQSTYLLVIIT